ncbi:MAG TPA: hypothetical protein VHW70_14045 [Edaphobacter sp.]|nr:hypothetical protein [Edaphobacter sp.]
MPLPLSLLLPLLLFFSCHPSPQAEDLLLLLLLLLHVPAVILNAVEDPEEPHSPQPLEPSRPHTHSMK